MQNLDSLKIKEEIIMTKVGINGFGRIGREDFRVEVVPFTVKFGNKAWHHLSAF